MLGILSTIMAIYGVGMAGGAAAYAVGGGIKSCMTSPPGTYIKDKDMPILHEVSPDKLSCIDRAYYEGETKRYVVRINCKFLNALSWISSRSMEGLRKKITEQYEENNKIYNMRRR